MIHTFSGPMPLFRTAGTPGWDSPHTACRGLYLWTYRMRSGARRVLYVGITTTTLASRTRAHLRAYATGEYYVHTRESLLNGSPDSRYPPRQFPIEEIIQRASPEWQQQLLESLRELELFFVPLANISTPELKALESGLIGNLKERHDAVDNSRKSTRAAPSAACVFEVAGGGVEGFPMQVP